MSDKPNHPCSFSEIEIRLNHEGITPYDPRVVGWASVVMNGDLKLNDLVIMQDRDGALILRFPSRKSRTGQQYNIFHPIRKDIHAELEKAVLGRLNQLRETTPGVPTTPIA